MPSAMVVRALDSRNILIALLDPTDGGVKAKVLISTTTQPLSRAE